MSVFLVYLKQKRTSCLTNEAADFLECASYCSIFYILVLHYVVCTFIYKWDVFLLN